MRVDTVALYASRASFTEALQQEAPPFFWADLNYYSEIHPATLSYLRSQWLLATSQGPCECAAWASVRADAVEVSFECAPYTTAVTMRMHLDPGARRAADAAHAMTAIRPLLALCGHVSNFFVLDDKHQLYSEAGDALARHMVCDLFLMEDSQWVAPWIGRGASQCGDP